MQKVLITGASGFVGFHLVEKCLAAGLDVYVAVRKSSSVEHLQHLKITYTYPDFSSVEKLQQELHEKQYDFIIHAAGTTKALNAEAYNAVNAMYTANLGKAVSQYGGIKKMVFMSSLGAIGPLNHYDKLIQHDQQPNPVTAYGKSKLLAEKALAEYDLPLVVLRPTAVYGPREKDIFIILKSISQGIEPYIGKTSQQLSFIYVKDLAQLTVNALFSPATGTYNVTDGRCYDRYQLADLTKKYLSKKTFRFHLPLTIVKGVAVLMETTYALLNKTAVLNKEKLNELTAMNWCCDISKLKSDLQFEPRFDLEAGLRETLEWYKANGWLK